MNCIDRIDIGSWRTLLGARRGWLKMLDMKMTDQNWRQGAKL